MDTASPLLLEIPPTVGKRRLPKDMKNNTPLSCERGRITGVSKVRHQIYITDLMSEVRFSLATKYITKI